MLLPLTHCSFAYVETDPKVSASAGIPPSVRYLLTAATSFPTLVTASETVGRVSETLRVHTTLSAVAEVFADPVTVIPLALRAANPAPTLTSPPPRAIARIRAIAM